MRNSPCCQADSVLLLSPFNLCSRSLCQIGFHLRRPTTCSAQPWCCPPTPADPSEHSGLSSDSFLPHYCTKTMAYFHTQGVNTSHEYFKLIFSLFCQKPTACVFKESSFTFDRISKRIIKRSSLFESQFFLFFWQVIIEIAQHGTKKHLMLKVMLTQLFTIYESWIHEYVY